MPITEELTDEELVQRYRTGPDPDEAFQELFHRYHGRIVGWCCRYTRDPEHAFDIAQEVFLKVFKHLSRFRGDSKFSTWLYVVARSQCLEAAKKRANEPAYAAGAISPNIPDHRHVRIDSQIEEDQSYKNLWSLIRGHVDQLEAEILILHYRQEMQLDTITRLLNLRNASGAKAYIVSARRKLSRLVQGGR
ncbi:MAG TPA: sigma-70 family RNA polymerase sigma factor [Bryobacteraceae bacterium]|nr:sigma-70 family RNA polymerase sigma factor [Bryobacteraceae bacterium]